MDQFLGFLLLWLLLIQNILYVKCIMLKVAFLFNLTMLQLVPWIELESFGLCSGIIFMWVSNLTPAGENE